MEEAPEEDNENCNNRKGKQRDLYFHANAW